MSYLYYPGCKTCTLLCPYKAIDFDENRKTATINQALCKGCGTCSAACPSGALVQNLFTNEQIVREIGGILTYV
jgi:heterodisulfide reductase subunit A